MNLSKVRFYEYVNKIDEKINKKILIKLIIEY